MDTKTRERITRLGGIARGIIARKESLNRYYSNPNICKECGKTINVREGERVVHVRIKKFCDHICSAKYTNRRRILEVKLIYSVCRKCGESIQLKPLKTGRYYKRKYCNRCLQSIRSENAQGNTRNLNLKYLGNRTKKDLFDTRKGYQSARSSIRKHAEQVYKISGKEYGCFICGYGVHTTVCHIKPVAKFSGSSLISEINDINNLIRLCSNHHWEYDHGIIDIDKFLIK